MEIELDRLRERVIIDGVRYTVPAPVVGLLLESRRRMHDAEIKLEELLDSEDVHRP
jgi:hypothetical protein